MQKKSGHTRGGGRSLEESSLEEKLRLHALDDMIERARQLENLVRTFFFNEKENNSSYNFRKNKRCTTKLCLKCIAK